MIRYVLAGAIAAAIGAAMTLFTLYLAQGTQQ